LTVRVFTDFSVSSTLTGQAGSLIGILDTCLVSGAGWTKAFSGTNKAAYRAPQGQQFYLRVDDTGPGAHGGREARVRGFESMTDVDTGTNPFPTVAQKANGLFVRKSATADTTVRPWRIYVDERTFYMFIQTGDIAGTYFGWTFGEIFSFKASDPGRTILIARPNEANASGSAGNEPFAYAVVKASNLSQPAHYLARGVGGGVGAKACGKIQAGLTSSKVLDSQVTEAMPIIGYLDQPPTTSHRWKLARLRVIEDDGSGNMVIRGRLRGLMQICNHPFYAQTILVDHAILTGDGNLINRAFQAVLVLGQGAFDSSGNIVAGSAVAMEFTDWEVPL